MRIKIQESWIFTVRIQQSHEVPCPEILTSSYATTRLKSEKLLQALKVVWFYLLKPDPHRNDDEDRVTFGNFLAYFIQENISIVADQHLKIIYRFILLVQVM